MLHSKRTTEAQVIQCTAQRTSALKNWAKVQGWVKFLYTCNYMKNSERGRDGCVSICIIIIMIRDREMVSCSSNKYKFSSTYRERESDKNKFGETEKSYEWMF